MPSGISTDQIVLLMGVDKNSRRRRIRFRIRKNVKGTAACPRLSVFRSNNEIYCQLIDDINGHTLASACTKTVGVDKNTSRVEQSKQVGKAIAEKALAENINNIIFDRSGYLYHGRVKALADGAREAGLKF